VEEEIFQKKLATREGENRSWRGPETTERQNGGGGSFLKWDCMHIEKSELEVFLILKLDGERLSRPKRGSTTSGENGNEESNLSRSAVGCTKRFTQRLERGGSGFPI